MSLQQLTEFLAEQASKADEDAARFHAAGRSVDANNRLALSRRFAEASESVRAMEVKSTSLEGDAPLLPGDLAGLPKELMDELNLSDSDQQEITLLEIMEELGGVATLDRLLVAWYRKQGEVLKRRALTSRLHRMVSKGRLFSVRGRKGVYSTTRQSKDGSISEFNASDALQHAESENAFQDKEKEVGE